MLDFLRKDLGLKILSIILAVGLWSYVKYTSTSAGASASSQSEIKVPVTVEGKDEKLVILDCPPEVMVTVKGSAETLSNLDPGHFKAVIDLKDRKVGQYNVRVNVTTPPGTDKMKVSPESVTLRLDPQEKRIFEVHVKPTGTIAGGFILGRMTTQPDSVTILGAQSIISRIKEAQAVCDLEGADMDRIQQVAVEAVNEDDKVIRDISVEPKFVRVSVKIKSEVNTATVPVNPEITGVPAQGFRLKSVEVVPKTVSIQYQYDLESPPQVVSTLPISIDGVKSDMEKDVTLSLPRDVTVISREKVRVSIKIIRGGDSEQD